MVELRQVSDCVFEIPRHGKMNVPARVYATRELMETQKSDEALQQLVNVAQMPGIVGHALAMPDFHWGYGFPIGGVAAFDPETGVISPGGIGYDINCGVRLIRTGLTREEVMPKIRDVVRAVYEAVPAGVGSEGAIPRLTKPDARDMLVRGAAWAVERGFGTADDLDAIEDRGTMAGANPDAVPDRAYQRGMSQIGTLGSGNHFLEIQVVEEVFHDAFAERFGLRPGTVVFSIHSGSRGFGHQTCEDYLRVMERVVKREKIELADIQLACAPLSSKEAKDYLGAMACAANYAWVNRQVMMAIAERAIAKAMGRRPGDLDARLIYDVCHNIAKFEEHVVDGAPRKVVVHRKGATRAFPPGHPAVPPRYRETGQPVFVPGDMGRASYLCLGAPGSMRETFGSTCHGAGRAHSRTAMIKMSQGRNLFREMEDRHGVVVMARGFKSVAEEMPDAYKDVGLVVDTMERAGISTKVVRLRPVGCVKG